MCEAIEDLGDLRSARGRDAFGGVECVRAVETFAESQAGHDPLGKRATRVGGFEVLDGGEAGVVDVEVVVETRGVLPAMSGDVGAGAGARGEPLMLTPVGEIVAGLLAGSGVVADLVPVEAGGSKGAEGLVVHLNLEIFIGGLELATLEARGHGGVGLVGEAVAGEMIDAEGEGGVEVGSPVVESLAWDREDEIDGLAGDACGFREGDRAGDVGRVVPAFEGLEVGGVEGLGAEAEAIDAAVAEDVEEFLGGGLGVALDGELAVARADP